MFQMKLLALLNCSNCTLDPSTILSWRLETAASPTQMISGETYQSIMIGNSHSSASAGLRRGAGAGTQLCSATHAWHARGLAEYPVLTRLDHSSWLRLFCPMS